MTEAWKENSLSFWTGDIKAFVSWTLRFYKFTHIFVNYKHDVDVVNTLNVNMTSVTAALFCCVTREIIVLSEVRFI